MTPPVGDDKHGFKKGDKGSSCCCGGMFNDENGKTVYDYMT